jgi:dTMP kinase
MLSSSHVRLSGTIMPTRGKLIVLEGIDGSGKRTQLEMLSRVFKQRGIPHEVTGFPNYSGYFGKLVAGFLNGEFGSLEEVDPHFSALLYAGDRFESKPVLEAALLAGKTLLADRYIASNLAHQGARVAPQRREEFLDWLRRLEYEIYGLPAEDLVIYLRLPVEEAHRLIGEKDSREYTSRRRDLQEASESHLAAAAEVYDELSRLRNWVKIECVESVTEGLRSPLSIHEEIASVVEARVFSAGHAGR